jgi:hypothetical protein
LTKPAGSDPTITRSRDAKDELKVARAGRPSRFSSLCFRARLPVRSLRVLSCRRPRKRAIGIRRAGDPKRGIAPWGGTRERGWVDSRHA